MRTACSRHVSMDHTRRCMHDMPHDPSPSPFPRREPPPSPCSLSEPVWDASRVPCMYHTSFSPHSSRHIPKKYVVTLRSSSSSKGNRTRCYTWSSSMGRAGTSTPANCQAGPQQHPDEPTSRPHVLQVRWWSRPSVSTQTRGRWRHLASLPLWRMLRTKDSHQPAHTRFHEVSMVVTSNHCIPHGTQEVPLMPR